MKRSIVLAALFSCAIAASAQVKLDKLQVQTRADHQSVVYDGDVMSGFSGKYFNVQLAGGAGEHLSFSYRQRLTKSVVSSSYWDATDWAWVGWDFSDKWGVTAGKQVVAIGGYEYDRAPINLYQCSEFWNNIACYQFGVNVIYRPSANATLTFQVCQSPNRTAADGMYAYNLIWYGNYGWWSPIWSVNMIESQPGRYIQYLSLGNRFELGNDFALELDLMNRTAAGCNIVGDFSIMSELSYHPTDKINAFAKYTYDRNEDNSLGFCVLPGTSISRTGAGVEYYPVRDNNILRLHAQTGYAAGKNGNPLGTIRNGDFFFDMGVTFFLDLLNIVR